MNDPPKLLQVVRDRETRLMDAMLRVADRQARPPRRSAETTND